MFTPFNMYVSNKKMEHFRHTKNMAVEINYTDAQYARADQRARELGVLKHSITNGKSNIWGMLGEEIIRDLLKCSDSTDIYNYDLMTPKGKRLEIKTKKTVLTIPPKYYFECSVCAHNTNQQCDMYVFLRVSTSCKKAWVCGYMERDDFFKKARYFKKGDRNYSNNHTIGASCYNLNVSELKNVVDLV